MKEFKCSRLFTGLSPTKLLFPDRIQLHQDKAIIIKRKWFGLTTDEEEIKYSRIASTRTKKGVFTATLIIETSGGSKDDLKVGPFLKAAAKEIHGELVKLVDVE